MIIALWHEGREEHTGLLPSMSSPFWLSSPCSSTEKKIGARMERQQYLINRIITGSIA
jgi:hypothetical protein